MPAFKDIKDAIAFFSKYNIEFQEGQSIWAGGREYVYKNGKWESLDYNEMV
ncbi:MAG TPA: hypothetical protein VKR58_09665 [Aquella sp.]|nr:hypothetical protein [Aquella sp.]